MRFEDRYPQLTAVITKTAALDAVRKLGKKGSRRSKQRAVALYIGATNENNGVIDKSDLHDALHVLGIFNSANWVQDMTKDAARGLWTIDPGYGRRGPGYWRLTDKGRELGALVLEAVRAGWNSLQETISKTLKITVSRIICPFCSEEVDDTDRTDCDACKVGAHATCHAELGRRSYGGGVSTSCFGMGCRGHMIVKAIPTGFAAEAPTSRYERCYSCNGSGWVTSGYEGQERTVRACERCAPEESEREREVELACVAAVEPAVTTVGEVLAAVRARLALTSPIRITVRPRAAEENDVR